MAHGKLLDAPYAIAMASDETNDAAQRIHAAIRAIPAGEVAAYGEISRRAGLPGRARLVARLLSRGAEPGLPWHRVVRADGRIAFPPGSSGFDEQASRLRAEGVAVVDGRVAGRPTRARKLDEALLGPGG